MSNYTVRDFGSRNFVDLSLYQFGYEECDPLHFFGPVARKHFLFHYIISGRGRLLSSDDRGMTNEYRLEGGQGFMLWPRQINTYFADEKNPWTYAWVEFDGLKAREAMTEAGLTYNYPLYVSNNNDERETMKRELLAIVQNKDDPPYALIGRLYLFVNALIASSSRRKKAPGSSMREFYAREFLSFIEQRYMDDISVEDMAAYCGLDRSYLGKVVRSAFSMSPQEFLIHYRLNKSQELMTVTDRTIGEISALVGYENPFNFSRVFKKIRGKSPRDWRNENKLK